MNLILLPSENSPQLIPAGTPAFLHLTQILHARAGMTFWCGCKNRSRGIAMIEKIVPAGLEISIRWENENRDSNFEFRTSNFENPLPAITILIGLSRPQTMKKVIANAAELGFQKMIAFNSENSDPSYAKSSLWRAGTPEITAILQKAAEQTCTTFFPEISLENSLESALNRVPANATGTVFDIYGDCVAANEIHFSIPAIFAIGSERGWTSRERSLFRSRAWTFAHLGPRILRVETAAFLAHSLVLAATKWEKHQPL